jgi:NADH:ubiquinone oxidoreductase subunit D
MLRGCGVPIDLRVNTPYEIYSAVLGKHLGGDCLSHLGKRGDSYDRYLIRMEEMRTSTYIMLECLNRMPPGRYSLYEKRAAVENNHMEMIIKHFKYYFENIKPAANISYTATEAPKGEFGVSFVSDATNAPYRCKFRAPGYYHLQGLPLMTKDCLLADLVTIIGTQDLVFGEIDK